MCAVVVSCLTNNYGTKNQHASFGTEDALCVVCAVQQRSHNFAIGRARLEFLRYRARWCWRKYHNVFGDQENAFQAGKDLLESAQVLAHFEETAKVVLACPTRTGWAVSQVLWTSTSGENHKLDGGSENIFRVNLATIYTILAQVRLHS